MMKKILLSYLFFCLTTPVFAAFEVFPPLPNREFESQNYEVSVEQNGNVRDSFVLTSVNDTKPERRERMTRANHWTTFEMDGKVTVRVRKKEGEIKAAVIRPLSRNVPYKIQEDGSLTFTLEKPENLFIDLEGCEREPLFVFANPLVKENPTAESDDTHYFGPGIHTIGEFEVTKPKTFLALGAYVKGTLHFTKELKKVEVFGSGILSGIENPHEKEWFSNFPMIEAHGKETVIRDLTLTDAAGVNILAHGKSTLCENVKIFAWASCTDGISGGPSTLIRGCFMKTMDDNIHITVSGTRAENCVHYLQAHGSAYVMGWSRTDDTENVHVSGVDIIGDSRVLFIPSSWKLKEEHRNAAIFVLNNMKGKPNGEGIYYHGLTAENVRCEVPMMLPVAIQIKNDFRMTNPAGEIVEYSEGFGRVSDLTFRNFTFLAKPRCRSFLDGNGTLDGTIQNVTFENWVIEGQKITNPDDLVILRGKTTGVTVR